MTGIKIPVSAAFEKGDVDRALGEFEQKFNRLGDAVAKANRVKFNPIDRATIDDIRKVTAAAESLRKVSGDFNKRLKATGQDKSSFFDIDWNKLYPDQHSRSRQMQKAFEYVGGNGRFASPASGGGGSGHPPPAAPPPGGSGGGGGGGGGGRNIVGAGLSAMGPAGRVANGALSTGMASGIGAGLGALAGGLAALAIGKVVGEVREKIGAAQQEFIGYDTLKRTLGDVNVSFNVLRESLRETSRSLDMTFEEGQRLGMQFAKLSGISGDQYRTLAEEVSNAGGFGRSFGLDPSQSNAFFAQMRMHQVTDSSDEKGSRRLALLIGESIAKSGAFSKADEVLEAIAGFTTQQTRMGMNTANVAGYASYYTGMVGSRMPGMDPSSSAALLGRVNASIAGGGGGEAGQNFMYSALGTRLGLDPIQTALLREQGAFGTGKGTFGSGSVYDKFAQQHGLSTPGAAGSDATNLQLIMEKLDEVYGGNPMLKVNAMSNLFGVNNSQAMALSTIKPAELGGLAKRLQRVGVNMNDVNATGISRIAQIEGDTSISDAEKDRRIKEAAGQNQEDTEGSRTRATINGVERAIQEMSGKLVPLMNDMRAGIMFMAGERSGMSSRQIMEAVAKADSKDREQSILGQFDPEIADAEKKRGLLKGKIIGVGSKRDLAARFGDDNERDALDEKLRQLEREETENQSRITALKKERAEKLEEEKARFNKDVSAIRGRGISGSVGELSKNQDFLAELNKTDEMIGAPRGFSAAQIMQESRFKPDAVSSAGAMGLAQVMPGTLAALEKRLGRKLDPSNWQDAATIHREVMVENRKKFGNYKDAARAYNGGWDPSRWGNSETAGYVPAIEGHMSRFSGETATPMPEGYRPGDQAMSREQQRAIELRGTFTLNGPGGQPAAAPVHIATSTGKPAPQGTW